MIQTMPKLATHPYCEILPAMTDDQYRDLVASIREHGLREPIVVDTENRIVDGRHRYRACIETGVVPKFSTIQLEGEKLIDWVIDTNVCRRHLDPSQRAMVSQRFIVEYRKARELAGRRYAERDVVREVSTKTGVPERTLDRADFVARNDPGLAKEVMDGKKTLHAAEQEIKVRTVAPQSGVAPIGANSTLLPTAAPASAVPTIKDDIGTVVPTNLVEIFVGGRAQSQQHRRELLRIADDLSKSPCLACAWVAEEIAPIIARVKASVPSLVCTECGGEGMKVDGPNARRGCVRCAGRGWIPASEVPEASPAGGRP